MKIVRIALILVVAVLVLWGSLILLAGQPQGPVTAGDVNVDGRVDCADVTIVRGSLGKNNGDPGFVAAADINRDNVVDQTDLNIVLSHLPNGMKCP